MALDPKSEVIDKLEKLKVDMLPVIDGNDHFVGIIHGKNILSVLKQDMATDMQTMVGVSKDERALSSSWFAVKKRLPWLQINLLTAFLARLRWWAFDPLLPNIPRWLSCCRSRQVNPATPGHRRWRDDARAHAA